MNKRFAAALLSAVLMGQPVLADAIGYDCRINTNRSHLGWIPQVIFVAHSAGADQATVSDPIILHYNDGQPLDARVAIENARRVTFAWTLSIQDRSNKRARMGYRATYITSSSEMTVSANPAGYENNFVAKGRCVLKPLG